MLLTAFIRNPPEVVYRSEGGVAEGGEVEESGQWKSETFPENPPE